MSNSVVTALTSLFSMTDEQAMWRIQAHDDAEAFAQLLRRWEGPIQRLCARMTGDVHRGQDLAQETFARIYARRKTYEPRGKFSTFLWRVALNLCYDELRRLNRRSEIRLDGENGDFDGQCLELADGDLSPDAKLAHEERAESVRRAVMRLPETYRSVIVLRHYENLKFREIAEVLEIPEGTVKSRMAEALSQLHRFLAQAMENPTPARVKPQSRRLEENLVL